MQCCNVTHPSTISQLIYNFMQLHAALGRSSGWVINYILAHKPIPRQLRSEGSMEDTLGERLVISEELACVPWLAVVRSFCKASDGVMPRFADNHLISRPALFAKNYRPSSIRAWYNHSKCLNHQMCAKSITWVKPYVWHMHPPSSIWDVCQRYKLAIFNGFINRHIWRLIKKMDDSPIVQIAAKRWEWIETGEMPQCLDPSHNGFIQRRSQTLVWWWWWRYK